MRGYIYLILNRINAKIYIGQHNGKNKKYFASGTVIKKALEKYGEQAFLRTIIRYCNSKAELDYWERFFIDYYGTYENSYGYNLTVGGEGVEGFKHTQEQKDKISLGNRGKKRTPEMNERNRQKHLGKKMPESMKAKKRELIGCKNSNWRGNLVVLKDGVKLHEFSDWESVYDFLGKRNAAVKSNVNYCTTGHLKSAYGYQWERKSNTFIE